MHTIVTFKWKPKKDYRSQFHAGHVNTAQRMIARHFPEPHRFLCITDDPFGIECETVPLWSEFSGLSNPTWAHGPSCYPRLKLFDPDIGKWIPGLKTGDTIISLDLDCVAVADLRPIFNRREPFLIWKTGGKTIPYCGSMFKTTVGRHPEVYRCFDPVRSPAETTAEGYRGSDQAWITFMLGTQQPGWMQRDGVWEYADLIPKRPNWVHRPDLVKRGRGTGLIMPTNAHSRSIVAGRRVERVYGNPDTGPLPPNARIVFFTGKPDPWDDAAQIMSPWIKEHYK